MVSLKRAMLYQLSYRPKYLCWVCSYLIKIFWVGSERSEEQAQTFFPGRLSEQEQAHKKITTVLYRSKEDDVVRKGVPIKGWLLPR